MRNFPSIKSQLVVLLIELDSSESLPMSTYLRSQVFLIARDRPHLTIKLAMWNYQSGFSKQPFE